MDGLGQSITYGGAVLLEKTAAFGEFSAGMMAGALGTGGYLYDLGINQTGIAEFMSKSGEALGQWETRYDPWDITIQRTAGLLQIAGELSQYARPFSDLQYQNMRDSQLRYKQYVVGDWSKEFKPEP